jgi:hypothetical protein
MAMHVATKISSCLGVFSMIPDSWVIWGNSGVCIWDVPEILAGEHSLCHILAEFHHLFPDVAEEGLLDHLPMSMIMNTASQDQI